MKTLSVILPIHNGAAFLRRNVEFLVELLPQLTHAFQIIIVDDGSIDGSDDIAAELERRFPQVTTVFSVRRQGEKMAIEWGKRIALFEQKFILATRTIEESKIRTFISQGTQHHQGTLHHVDPEPSRKIETPSAQHLAAQHLAPSFPAAPNPISPDPISPDPISPDPISPDSAPTQPGEKNRLPTATPASDSLVDFSPSNKPLTNFELTQRLREQDQVEQQLVERLMKWGIALKEYRNHLEGKPNNEPDFPDSNECPDSNEFPDTNVAQAEAPRIETDRVEMAPGVDEHLSSSIAVIDNAEPLQPETAEGSFVQAANWERQLNECQSLSASNEAPVSNSEGFLAATIERTAVDQQVEPHRSDSQAIFRSISIPEQRLIRMCRHDLKRGTAAPQSHLSGLS